MNEVREIHFKLLLQESADCAITEAISNQSGWITEIEDSSAVFKSFLSSCIGSSFVRRQKILDTLLERCLAPTFKKWKYLLWMVRVSVTGGLDIDQRNELKELVKSTKYSRYGNCNGGNNAESVTFLYSSF